MQDNISLDPDCYLNLLLKSFIEFICVRLDYQARDNPCLQIESTHLNPTKDFNNKFR